MSRLGQHIQRPSDWRRSICSAAWALAFILLSIQAWATQQGPFQIVAVGASNTAGWGVGQQHAFPARLEALLKANGIQASVKNAGVVASTTNGMLRRLDTAVPAGTHLVILQPGSNDLRFFGTVERRQANIAEIQRRLRARGIQVIVCDPVIPREWLIWDGIHFTPAAHAQIAAQLLPLVVRAWNHSAQGN